VIGAGIGGVSAAAYLLKEGLSVTVFERSGVVGGIWHFDERIPKDPLYPSQGPSLGDFKVSQRGEFASLPLTPPPEPFIDEDIDADLEVSFAPPGPCYAGLKTNIPTNVLVSSLGPWPEGTEQLISQELAEKYIQGLATEHGVTAVTQFHTRVDEVRTTTTPDGAKWEVRTVSLSKEKEHGSAGLKERLWHFDLVVVATGHYSMPRVPDFPGLKELKAAFPERIIHSKQYRRPQRFQGQNVLVIGAGVSSSDICRELAGVANKVYQSVRGGMYDTPAHLLPNSTLRVSEIAEFRRLKGGAIAGEQHLAPVQPIPAQIVLRDGAALDDIHHVVLATGYITSYPFLAHLHSDEANLDEAGDDVLITSDGNMVHNLHRDIFYIPDPTLAFIGVPYHAATFTLFGFQAQALARVFAGSADLPAREVMVEEYKNKIKEKELGRSFHSLARPGAEVDYVMGLVNWVNNDGDAVGKQRILAPAEEWVKEYDVFKTRLTGEWFGEKSQRSEV